MRRDGIGFRMKKTSSSDVLLLRAKGKPMNKPARIKTSRLMRMIPNSRLL